MTSIRDQAGFTLVEMLVIIIVLGLMSSIIATFTVNNLRESTLAAARQGILSETQSSLDIAANDIRLSANADDDNRWPDNNGPAAATLPYSWASDTTTLVLATAAQTAARDIIFADSKNYITEKNNIIYFVRGGTLYKRILASTVSGNSAKTTCPANLATPSCPADRELLRNVTAFTVKYLNGQGATAAATDARAIELQVSVARKVYSQTLTASYTTRMVFRND